MEIVISEVIRGLEAYFVPNDFRQFERITPLCVSCIIYSPHGSEKYLIVHRPHGSIEAQKKTGYLLGTDYKKVFFHREITERKKE